MSSVSLYVALYVIVAAFSLYLGYSLRKWRFRSVQTKLIRDIEAVLQEPVPRFKKGQHVGQVNWDRVYNLLKKLPRNEANDKLLTRIDQFMRQFRRELNNLRS